MIRCTKGCASTDLEWCSECGAKMPAPSPPPPPPAPREPCPDCGTPRTGRFCERCRYDFSARASSHPVTETASTGSTLELVVTVDAQEGEPTPADRTPVYALAGSELLVGRRSDVKDIHPEVPLNDDPGVSHRHAKLLRDEDGWAVLDLGSSNGTELNGTLLGPGIRARLEAGDELRLGIRTVIRVRER